jgi:hypothetical protein
MHKEDPVIVDVACKNVDIGELLVNAHIFSSKALKDAFNSIHEAIDGSKLATLSCLATTPSWEAAATFVPTNLLITQSPSLARSA